MQRFFNKDNFLKIILQHYYQNSVKYNQWIQRKALWGLRIHCLNTAVSFSVSPSNFRLTCVLSAQLSDCCVNNSAIAFQFCYIHFPLFTGYTKWQQSISPSRYAIIWLLTNAYFD
jgi:hypothetical protein